MPWAYYWRAFQSGGDCRAVGRRTVRAEGCAARYCRSVYALLAANGPTLGGAGGFASNGVDGASPGKFGMGAAFVAEVLLTAMLLMIIMGSTHKLAAAGAAPIAIGLALVEGGVALQQLWLFARRDRLSDLAGRQRLTAMATKAEAPALYGAEAFFLSAADQPQWPFLSAQMLR